MGVLITWSAGVAGVGATLMLWTAVVVGLHMPSVSQELAFAFHPFLISFSSLCHGLSLYVADFVIASLTART